MKCLGSWRSEIYERKDKGKLEIEKIGSELVTKSNMLNAREIETNYIELVDVN